VLTGEIGPLARTMSRFAAESSDCTVESAFPVLCALEYVPGEGEEGDEEGDEDEDS
jgi:hypothetical protein